MLISEDEFEHRSVPVNTMGMTKAELRRSNKPIMEKKRRARINHCLNELKTLILDAMKKDPARHSKLEKADILEMTVKHLQTVQRQQLAVAVATDPSVLHKFKTGFSDCASEVSRFVGHLEGVEPAVKQRLVAHLTSCVSGLQQIAPFQFPTIGGNTPIQQFGGTTMPVNLQIPQNNNIPQTSLPPFSGDVNNNQNRIQMNGMQLIPSRLPTGELALVMPNSNNIPFFPPNTNFPTSTHTSAFSSVSRSTNIRPASPPLSPSSSVSSYEDSLTSDYPPVTTPPLQIHINSNMSSTFPTPPSQSSNKNQNLSPQQALISSTTISPESKAVEVQNKNNYNINKYKNDEQMKIQYVNKKRPYPVEISGRLLSVAEPANKMMRISQNSVSSSSSSSVIVRNENEDHVNQINRDNVMQNQNNQPQASNDMWRPW